MEVSVVAKLQQTRDVRAGLLEIAGSFISRGQITFIALVRRIQAVGGFEQRQRLAVSTGTKVVFAELMVGGEGSRSAGERCAQTAFGLACFRHPTGGVCDAWFRILSFERERLTREILAGSQDG